MELASLEIVGALLATSSLEIGSTLWKFVRERLAERGSSDLPPDVANLVELHRAEVVVVEEGDRLPQDEAQDLTVRAVEFAQQAANGIRAERLRQAKWTFNAALTLTILGAILVFIGVIVLFTTQNLAAGAITAGTGAVTEVISALLFRLNHETNNRLDEVSSDLGALEAARIAVSLSERIEDPAKRDDAITSAADDLRTRGRKRSLEEG